MTWEQIVGLAAGIGTVGGALALVVGAVVAPLVKQARQAGSAVADVPVIRRELEVHVKGCEEHRAEVAGALRRIEDNAAQTARDVQWMRDWVQANWDRERGGR